MALKLDCCGCGRTSFSQSLPERGTMGDFVGILIFVGFILLSVFQKFAQKSQEEGDERSVEERLQDAIRRSMERASGKQDEDARASGPPNVLKPPRRAAARPQPSPPRQRVPIPAPRQRTPPLPASDRASGTFKTSAKIPPAPVSAAPPIAAPWGETPRQKLRRDSEANRAEASARAEATWESAGASRADYDSGAEDRRAERLTPRTGASRRSFTRRQLQELVIFSELLARPRIIRNHPMYQQIPKV